MNELLVFDDNRESVTITVKASTGFFLESPGRCIVGGTAVRNQKHDINY